MKEYKEWKIIKGYNDEEHETEEKWLFSYLSDEIFNLATYDSELDEKYGELIYITCKAIIEKRNFEIIETDFYEKFILILQFLDKMELIEWGTSIRGCWFEYNSIEDKNKIEQIKWVVNEIDKLKL